MPWSSVIARAVVVALGDPLVPRLRERRVARITALPVPRLDNRPGVSAEVDSASSERQHGGHGNEERDEQGGDQPPQRARAHEPTLPGVTRMLSNGNGVSYPSGARASTRVSGPGSTGDEEPDLPSAQRQRLPECHRRQTMAVNQGSGPQLTSCLAIKGRVH